MSRQKMENGWGMMLESQRLFMQRRDRHKKNVKELKLKSFSSSGSIEEEIHRSEILINKKKETLGRFQAEKKKYEDRKAQLEKLLQDRTASLLRMKANRNFTENKVNLLHDKMKLTQKNMLEYGEKNSEIRKKLEQASESFSTPSRNPQIHRNPKRTTQ